MRFWEVWNRPAVSARTRSAPRAVADSTASNTTDAGSAPSAPRTMWAEERSAHMASWSAAAARKVSPAARTTRAPRSLSRLASLPMVVVLPVPFTPTKSHTDGRSPSPRRTRERSKPPRRRRSSAWSAATACAGSSLPVATRALAAVTISELTDKPTSARIRASVTSVQASSEIEGFSRAEASEPANAALALPRRSRSEGLASAATPRSRSATRSITLSAIWPMALSVSKPVVGGRRRRRATSSATATSTAAARTARTATRAGFIRERPARR